MNVRFRHSIAPLIGLASVLAVGLAQVGEVSASSSQQVDIVGSQDLGESSNGLPYTFKQGRIVVHQGDTVTWRNLSNAPHSMSVVDASTLPTSAAQMDNCPACEQYLAEHAPVIGQDGPQPPFVAALDDHRVSAAELPQLNSLGDSVLIAELGKSYPSTVGGTIGDEASAAITAPRGSTLEYFCALHPWMVGTIEVK